MIQEDALKYADLLSYLSDVAEHRIVVTNDTLAVVRLIDRKEVKYDSGSNRVLSEDPLGFKDLVRHRVVKFNNIYDVCATRAMIIDLLDHAAIKNEELVYGGKAFARPSDVVLTYPTFQHYDLYTKFSKRRVDYTVSVEGGGSITTVTNLQKYKEKNPEARLQVFSKVKLLT